MPPQRHVAHRLEDHRCGDSVTCPIFPERLPPVRLQVGPPYDDQGPDRPGPSPCHGRARSRSAEAFAFAGYAGCSTTDRDARPGPARIQILQSFRCGRVSCPGQGKGAARWSCLGRDGQGRMPSCQIFGKEAIGETLIHPVHDLPPCRSGPVFMHAVTPTSSMDFFVRHGASTPATMAHRCRRGTSTPSLVVSRSVSLISRSGKVPRRSDRPGGQSCGRRGRGVWRPFRSFRVRTVGERRMEGFDMRLPRPWRRRHPGGASSLMTAW